MDQRKYLVYAVLILLAGAGVYFAVQKLSKKKIAGNRSTIIDYNEPADSLTKPQIDGKIIFQGRCASCHHIFKDLTGNILAGVESKWPDKKELFAFIRNPAAVMARNAYARKLKAKYGSMMTSFTLTDKEIQAILNYIKSQ